MRGRFDRWHWGLLALSLVIIAVSTPAWTGTYIYDDWKMQDNQASDGVEDLVFAFARTSKDYLGSDDDIAALGTTYRPLSHVTLIAVQALGGSPLVHHLISLGLHLVCVFLLYAVLSHRGNAMWAFSLASVFALHPLTIEAYGWINGRSDVLAGVALVALAWVLTRRQNLKTGLMACTITAAAVLSKETAVIATSALLVSTVVPQNGETYREILRSRGITLIIGILGVALALGLRALFVEVAQAGFGTFISQQDLVLKVVRLYAKALNSALIPMPRTMATLGWGLWRPLNTPEILLLAVAVGVTIWLLYRKAFRAVVLIAGAALTLVPTVVVSNSFWSGFDRYLYMPAILICLSLKKNPTAKEKTRIRTVVQRVSLPLIACILAASSYATAQNYASQSAFMASMIQLRPEDPSGYLFGANWMGEAGDNDAALKLLDRVPERGLPRPLASRLVTRLSKAGRVDRALSVFEDMIRRYPDDPFALYDSIPVRLELDQYAKAFEAAERLRGYPSFCRGVKVLLRKAEKRSRERTRIEKFRSSYSCL
jgi:pentatricopeptide repeat protein